MAERALPPVLDVVAGETSPPEETLDGTICDPNDARPIEPQRASSARALERAIAFAEATSASGAWGPVDARAALLERIAGELEARAEAMALADAATTGVVLSLTRAMARIPPHAFRAAAALLRAGELRQDLAGRSGAVEVLREPWGAAAVIAPWNAPSAIAAHKVASALAAGCSVVLKPSEHAPHACALLAEAVRAAGAPAGALQVVHGGAAVGARLVADARVRAVSFTGGLEGGRSVARACAEQLKPAQLELGGNNPLLVLEDADLDAACEGIVAGLVTLNGQWCRALGRVFVHARHHDALLARVLERFGRVRLGSSLDAASEMGPLAYAAHRARVVEAIARLRDRGGEVHRATRVPPLGGWFLAPTLVTRVAAEDAVDESFGPVATMHPFARDDDAVRMANASPFGLAAYVFSADEARARAIARRLRAGSIKINGVSLLSLHPDAPRAAWGLSGLGDEGTRESLRFFCGARVIGVASQERTG